MMWHICVPTRLLKGVVMTGGRAHSVLSILRPELRAFLVNCLKTWLVVVVGGGRVVVFGGGNMVSVLDCPCPFLTIMHSFFL